MDKDLHSVPRDTIFGNQTLRSFAGFRSEECRKLHLFCIDWVTCSLTLDLDIRSLLLQKFRSRSRTYETLKSCDIWRGAEAPTASRGTTGIGVICYQFSGLKDPELLLKSATLLTAEA